MADLTASRYVSMRWPNLCQIEMWAIDTSVARSIYKGQPVILDMNVDDKNIAQFVDAVVLAAGDVTVGIALEPAEVEAGDAETKKIPVLMSGQIGFIQAGFTDADVGKIVYFSDSGLLTVTKDGNNTLKIGNIARVIDGLVYVAINPGGVPIVHA